jgi:hypothetical protein
MNGVLWAWAMGALVGGSLTVVFMWAFCVCLRGWCGVA